MAKARPKPKPGAVKHITAELRNLAVPLADITVDPANARTHDAANVSAIRASIARYGQRKPVVVNTRNGHIEAGNGTYEAMRAAGHNWIAVVYVSDDPASQVGYSIADNRTAELAEWDNDILADLLDQHGETLGGDFAADLLLDELLGDTVGQQSEAALGEVDPPPATWPLVVMCKSADDRNNLAKRMRQHGRTTDSDKGG